MNILLIYPEFVDTFWGFKHALKFIGKDATFPPLGLLTVASMLPDDWNVRLCDMNVERLRKRDLAWADYAFISAMTVQKKSSKRVLQRCLKEEVKTVAGGPLFTIEPQSFPEVDHFVLNEAEVTLPDFIRDVRNGNPRREYTSTDFPDMTQTPIPRWDLLNLKEYASMCIQYSRGCPFNCDFCNVTSLFGQKQRYKSSSQITSELQSLVDAGWKKDVFFVDDNFIGNKGRLKRELLPDLIEWHTNHPTTNFNTEASMNIADDPELMDMLVRSGFNKVFIGIETPDEESLTACSKIQNTKRDLIEDVKKIQRAGLQVQGGFIVGFDSDTESIFQRQIDFIQKSGIVTAMVGLLQAPFGTRLYDRMQEEGRIIGDTTGDNVDGSMNIVPIMNAQKLKNGYHEILNKIYSPRPYYQRVKTFLREYDPASFKAKLSRQDIWAFVKSLFRLGIIGKERFQYWKLLVWTAVHRKRSLPDAVTLAIYGFHFRKVCIQNIKH
ncbi:MAG: B12-binding domain-containing radical SAM protein [Spirochaetales bacterium]|nr:B12-binding domain-containing radical SAM protein [Spirochaetales bacterium]MCF7937538.1 B12-binding domain-containing radical SAM protein [Spirochaetales bacterium]